MQSLVTNCQYPSEAVEAGSHRTLECSDDVCAYYNLMCIYIYISTYICTHINVNIDMCCMHVYIYIYVRSVPLIVNQSPL